MSRLDLNRLQVFREVVLAGSFSKAAAQLRQPKSRISRHIAALEKQLGTQLIYRTTRHFRLTKVGEELFQKASPLLSELTSTLDTVSSDAVEISGSLKVTVPEDIGVELMGQLCHEFLELYPKVQIHLHTSNQYVNLVEQSVDVAIRVGKAKDSSMIQKKLGHLGLVFVASPEFKKRRGLKTLEDLESLPFLAFAESDSDTVRVTLSSQQKTRTLKLHPAFVANNFFTLRDMAIRGSGFARIPILLAREPIRSGFLVELFSEWQMESHLLQILIPQQKEIPLRIRKFMDFMTLKLSQINELEE